jgi:hypothetical protein
VKYTQPFKFSLYEDFWIYIVIYCLKILILISL